jgi:hypothetical protein
MSEMYTEEEIRKARKIVGTVMAAQSQKTLKERFTAKQISAMRSAAAKARWARVSKEAKSAHGKKMAKAHWEDQPKRKKKSPANVPPRV